METKIIKVSPKGIETDYEVLIEPATALRNGELVAFPTETVYGIGANSLLDDSVRKIFEVKGRPQDNPLIVHLHSKDIIGKYAIISNEVEEGIISKFMPGPITVVLRNRGVVSSVATAGLDTVGIRIPYNIIAQKLLELAGVPVSAPSANLSGKPSATDPVSVIEDFKGRIPYIIDGGRTHIGIESTVVMVKEEVDKFRILILRPGFITKEDLEGFVSENKFSKPVFVEYSENFSSERPISPGQKYRHYSPKSKVVLLNDKSKLDEFFRVVGNGRIGILGRFDFINDLEVYLINLGFKDILKVEWCGNDLLECARNLFLYYRFFDREGVEFILVENLGDSGIAYSIMNRVRKSASYVL